MARKYNYPVGVAALWLTIETEHGDAGFRVQFTDGTVRWTDPNGTWIPDEWTGDRHPNVMLVPWNLLSEYLHREIRTEIQTRNLTV